MFHVITDLCIKCMNCTKICPVTCIHPCEDEPELGNVPQVYINPGECINCGSCVPECPVNAIFPVDDLPADKKQFAQINADYFK